MYRVLFDNHINSIKKTTGLVAAFLSLLAIIANISFSTKIYLLINLIILSINLILFIISAFMKGLWTRYIQIIIFITMGITTLVLSEIYLLGDIICVAGIFYLYIYRIIKKYDKKTFPLLMGCIILVRIGVCFFVTRDSIILETLAAVFIFTILSLIIYIFQNQINWYIMRSYLLEKFMRVGMNASNLVHEQNLDFVTSQMDFAVSKIDDGDPEKAKDIINTLADLTDKYNRNRRIFLKSFTEDHDKAIDLVFDINEILESLSFFEYLNHDFETKFFIEVIEEYYPDPLIMKTNKYEITGVLQNLISNAVDAMRGKKEREYHKLIIRTEKEKERAIVWITDTGPGFPKADKRGRVKVDSIKSSKENGGFGYMHITFFTQLHGGTLEIFNNSEFIHMKKGEAEKDTPDSRARRIQGNRPAPDEGATVKLTLPLMKDEEEGK